MKKILLAFDGLNFSGGAFEFARKLNAVSPVLLSAAFLPQTDYANLWSFSAAASADTGLGFIPLIEGEEADQVQENIHRFESLCRQHGIAYKVHRDYFDFVLPGLKKESRFADLLLLSSQLFYKSDAMVNNFEYIQDVVKASECPVLLVPETAEFPAHNLLAYDGSAESVYALRQFAYIFPEFTDNPTRIIYVEEKPGSSIPSKELVTELAGRHFPDHQFIKLDPDAEVPFPAWLRDQPASILVSGSLSRSSLSQLFKKSFLKEVIVEHQLPVFVANH